MQTKFLRHLNHSQEDYLMHQAAAVAVHKTLLKKPLSNLLQAPRHRELLYIEILIKYFILLSINYRVVFPSLNSNSN
jgi:hypothetical protein